MVYPTAVLFGTFVVLHFSTNVILFKNEKQNSPLGAWGYGTLQYEFDAESMASGK